MTNYHGVLWALRVAFRVFSLILSLGFSLNVCLGFSKVQAAEKAPSPSASSSSRPESSASEANQELASPEPAPRDLQEVKARKVGQINSLKGMVRIDRSGRVYRALVASPLTPSDVVETQAGAEARLVMKDFAVVVLSEKTRFKVSEYPQNTRSNPVLGRSRKMELSEGKIQVQVPKMKLDAGAESQQSASQSLAAEGASGNANSGQVKTPPGKGSSRAEGSGISPSFEIRTSIATVGVRGTEFEMSHSPEVTEVYVKEGRVEIWPHSQAENKMLVSAGQRVQVRKVGDQILKPQLMGQK